MKFNVKYLVVLLFFLPGCASVHKSNLPPDEYFTECSKDVEILRSYGDTIRIEYEPSRMLKADKYAEDYCLFERKKNSIKNQVSCDGCCKATYICKKK
tara:strand:- start:634 stop:927 length:294 start_codon:yes stop_codon:yes gene_type:complete